MHQNTLRIAMRAASCCLPVSRNWLRNRRCFCWGKKRNKKNEQHSVLHEARGKYPGEVGGFTGPLCWTKLCQCRLLFRNTGSTAASCHSCVLLAKDSDWSSQNAQRSRVQLDHVSVNLPFSAINWLHQTSREQLDCNKCAVFMIAPCWQDLFYPHFVFKINNSLKAWK